MVEATARHGLPLLVSGQGQKDITHNEAIMLLDGLVAGVIESRSIGMPPANPDEGACWLVAENASGFWLGKAGQLAISTAGGWRFAAIPDGMLVYAKDEGTSFRKVGVYWRDQAPLGAPVAAVSLPAGGSVVDIQARAAFATLIGRLQQLGLVAI